MLHNNIVQHKHFNNGLTASNYYVLIVLSKHEFLSMSEISKKLTMPKPNISALVDKLIKEGLLERHYDKTDRRIINVRLTKQGNIAINDFKKNVRNHFKEKLSSLTEKDLEKLSKSLQNIKDILVKILD